MKNSTHVRVTHLVTSNSRPIYWPTVLRRVTEKHLTRFSTHVLLAEDPKFGSHNTLAQTGLLIETYMHKQLIH